MKKLVFVIVILIFAIEVAMAHPVGNYTNEVSHTANITLPFSTMADMGQMVKLTLFTSLLMLAGTNKQKK